jgi:hypothetical protein
VVLHLSKLNGTPTTLADWLNPNLTDTDQHTQSISIGALLHFAVGDIWANGRRESMPDYELETFTDIQVDANTTSIIKAGLNPDEEGFLLPQIDTLQRMNAQKLRLPQSAIVEGMSLSQHPTNLLNLCLDHIELHFANHAISRGNACKNCATVTLATQPRPGK